MKQPYINLIIGIFCLSIAIFIGFAVGRFGDKYFGYTNTPHHWIYGFALIGLGIGLFISDLNDFIILPLLSPEPEHIWKFWSIN